MPGAHLPPNQLHSNPSTRHYPASDTGETESNTTGFTYMPGAYPPAQHLVPRPIGMTLFRYNTVQTIPLTTAGNFVVDVPVPLKVLESGKYRSGEFSHLRCELILQLLNGFKN